MDGVLGLAYGLCQLSKVFKGITTSQQARPKKRKKKKRKKKKKEKKVPSCIRTSGHLDCRATMISITPRGTRIEDL